MSLDLRIGSNTFRVESGEVGTLQVNGESHRVDYRKLGTGIYSLLVDGASHEVLVRDQKGGVLVEVEGHLIPVQRGDLSRPAREAEGKSGPATVTSPMPGRVIVMKVKEGQSVRKGDGLLVVEAMKMENELTAPKSGKVVKISVGVGEAVEGGQELVTIE